LITDGTLVIHDSTFDGNSAGYVRGGVVVSRIFLIFLPCPGGGHATSRAQLFTLMGHLSRSTPAFSRATALAK
jgi:hypothetical protein